jgi:hypothetical protein
MRAPLYVVRDAHAAATLLRTSRSNPRIFLIIPERNPWNYYQSRVLHVCLYLPCIRETERVSLCFRARGVLSGALFAHLLFPHVALGFLFFRCSTNRHTSPDGQCYSTTDRERVHRRITNWRSDVTAELYTKLLSISDEMMLPT